MFANRTLVGVVTVTMNDDDGARSLSLPNMVKSLRKVVSYEPHIASLGIWKEAILGANELLLREARELISIIWVLL